METYKKYANQQDIRFWIRMSNLDDTVLMVMFQRGKGLKRQYKRLLEDEEKIASIEL